ncbi:MAG: glycosyltransferase [Saprospiraceae bacterium]
MKILIISPYYFPNINPRPYRWTRIAEIWAKNGHEVTVVTEKQTKLKNHDNLNGVKIRRVGYAAVKSLLRSGKRGIAGPKKQISWFQKIAKFVNNRIWKKLYFPDDSFIWYFPAMQTANSLVTDEKIEILVSSSLPFTAHLIALRIKRKNPNLRWIADCGDPFSFQTEAPLNNHFLYGRLNRYFEKQVLKFADQISVTCESTKDRYTAFYPAIRNKIFVIPPMLSKSEKVNSMLVDSDEIRSDNGKIILAYFGKFYSKIREAKLLTNFLKLLFATKPELVTKIEVHIFGDIYPEFIPELEQIDQIKVFGLIPRESVKDKMSKVDLLINVSNNTDYQLPSKAPDYLNSGKPILNISNHRNDEFANFFSGHPLFCNYEVSTTDIKECVLFIENCKGKSVDQSWTTDKIAPYQAETIAAQYLALF